MALIKGCGGGSTTAGNHCEVVSTTPHFSAGTPKPGGRGGLSTRLPSGRSKGCQTKGQYCGAAEIRFATAATTSAMSASRESRPRLCQQQDIGAEPPSASYGQPHAVLFWQLLDFEWREVAEMPQGYRLQSCGLLELSMEIVMELKVGEVRSKENRARDQPESRLLAWQAQKTPHMNRPRPPRKANKGQHMRCSAL